MTPRHPKKLGGLGNPKFGAKVDAMVMFELYLVVAHIENLKQFLGAIEADACGAVEP